MTESHDPLFETRGGVTGVSLQAQQPERRQLDSSFVRDHKAHFRQPKSRPLPFQASDNFATAERAERRRRCQWLAEQLGIPSSNHMGPLRARVEKGRLVLDEPTTLPEGTVVDLVADDEGDDLTNDERRALHDALLTSWRSAEAGSLQPASRILDELRRRR
jgi:hypothetical protein